MLCNNSGKKHAFKKTSWGTKKHAVNKKQKGIKKVWVAWFLKILPISLVNFDAFQKTPAEYKQLFRFTVFQGEMEKRLSLKQNYLNLLTKDFTSWIKSHRKLFLYHQVLMSQPKLFNINQKNDFSH